MAQAFVSAFQAVNEGWETVSGALKAARRDVEAEAAALPWAGITLLLKDYRASYATARFTSGRWKVLSKFFNTSDIQNLHWDINCWGDEEVKAWKNNCISGYGAVAVAVRRRIWTQYFISV
jgi:hypothetical protein